MTAALSWIDLWKCCSYGFWGRIRRKKNGRKSTLPNKLSAEKLRRGDAFNLWSFSFQPLFIVAMATSYCPANMNNTLWRNYFIWLLFIVCLGVCVCVNVFNGRGVWSFQEMGLRSDVETIFTIGKTHLSYELPETYLLLRWARPDSSGFDVETNDQMMCSIIVGIACNAINLNWIPTSPTNIISSIWKVRQFECEISINKVKWNIVEIYLQHTLFAFLRRFFFFFV